MLTIQDLKTMSADELRFVGEQQYRLWVDNGDINHLKISNAAKTAIGISAGWWDDINDQGEPVKFTIFRMSMNTDITNMAAVIHKLGFVKSISQARREGWDKPIELGVYKYGKIRKFKIIE